MNRDEIRSVLLETLSDIAPEGEFDRLAPDRPLRDQLDIDSYDFLQWMVALHERLGVDIPEADYPRLTTLNGAIDYVASHAAAPQQ
jgi:acyl carrier protein